MTILKIGDIIEQIVKPAARVAKSKCLDKNGKLKPGSPCAKRRDWLNKIGRGQFAAE